MSQPTIRPWGLSRLAAYTETVWLPYSQVELDPITQTGRYLDGSGHPVTPVTMGSIKQTQSPTQAPGPDGGDGKPPAPGQPDQLPDEVSD